MIWNQDTFPISKNTSTFVTGVVVTSTGFTQNLGRKIPWLLIQFYDLKMRWKQWVKCPSSWMFRCLTQSCLNFYIFQPSTKNNSGEKLKFHDFSITQIIFLISMTFPGLECNFQIPWISMTLWWVTPHNFLRISPEHHSPTCCCCCINPCWWGFPMRGPIPMGIPWGGTPPILLYIAGWGLGRGCCWCCWGVMYMPPGTPYIWGWLLWLLGAYNAIMLSVDR